MNDKITFDYPCFVLTVSPFRFTEKGQQIVAESTYFTIESTDGTTFLIIFRKLNNLNHFLFDSGACGQSLTMVVDTPRNLEGLIAILSKRLNTPIGLLVDPDSELKGFPVSPENSAKLVSE